MGGGGKQGGKLPRHNPKEKGVERKKIPKEKPLDPDTHYAMAANLYFQRAMERRKGGRERNIPRKSPE